MRSKQMALLTSITVHFVLGYLLLTQTFKQPSSKQAASLKTYIIPIAQQRKILAEIVKPKDEQKPEPKQQEVPEKILKKVVVEQVNSPKKVAEPPVPKSTEKPLKSAPKTQKKSNETKAKVIKFNRYKSIESVIEKEQQAYFKSQQFNNQISQPKVKIKPSQKYQDLVNGQTEVVTGSVASSRKTIKYKGKCYLVDSNSEMGSMDMPSSSGFPCPGEKSDNEILLKNSLNKYLKKK
ncbi:hypothetical protein [Pseudoalteromonas spongiae]|uniref:hypothetical protein n=1 Tax=Pseudoalteromonas spongiae TaxID=298657 RepID=UPI00110C0181|nr:hypothetical protein [Pseudoalteromonas spongiae]TMO83943.1 hypothetical protein CWC15_12490 [Pseudoalteromonas spongiae]